MINKVCSSVAEAVANIPEGATVMVGGFGASGSPIELIHALIDHGARELTVINNNTGNGEVGLAALIGNGQVSKMICSFPRSSQSRVLAYRINTSSQAFLSNSSCNSGSIC